MTRGRNVTVALAVSLCCVVPSFGNLLVNGDFESNFTGGADGLLSAGWSKAPGTNNAMFDGTTHTPNPLHFQGNHHGSTDIGGNSAATAIIYQTVNVMPGGQLHLTGALNGGTTGPPCTFFVRLHDGADYNAPVLAAFEVTEFGTTWSQVQLDAMPTGNQVTLSWGYTRAGGPWGIIATHADAFNLIQDQPTCQGGDPVVTDFSPNFGANTGNLNITVNGSGFDPGSQVLLRRSGFSDVLATGEVVNGAGTQITATLPLNGVAMGKWDLVVTKPNCNDKAAGMNFVVANTTINNGSFELPTAASSCPTPVQLGAPTGWLQTGVSTESNHLVRDATFGAPSCPRPDGGHYASIYVPQGTSIAFWEAYQYLAVTPGQPVSVCANFAGSGFTVVNLTLREGDEDGAAIATQVIENHHGCPAHTYDWVLGCVTGTPVGGLVTLEWSVDPIQTAGAANVAHADHFRLGAPPAEVCDNGIDDDGDRATDCQDSDCAAAPGCSPAPVEICDNNLDDDGDVAIDCLDPDCAEVCVEICGNGVDDDFDCEVDEDCEDCTNGVDDNGDTLIDCDDPTCAGNPICPSEDCTNGVDDDGDLLADCADPSCASHPACTCNSPFADADGDQDVDQEDFGLLQDCFTGPGPHPLATDGAYSCKCFDRENDNDVDQADVAAFENCATGPAVLFDAELKPDCNP